jgi:hypothetical protein
LVGGRLRCARALTHAPKDRNGQKDREDGWNQTFEGIHKRLRSETGHQVGKTADISISHHLYIRKKGNLKLPSAAVGAEITLLAV